MLLIVEYPSHVLIYTKYKSALEFLQQPRIVDYIRDVLNTNMMVFEANTYGQALDLVGHCTNSLGFGQPAKKRSQVLSMAMKHYGVVRECLPTNFPEDLTKLIWSLTFHHNE